MTLFGEMTGNIAEGNAPNDGNALSAPAFFTGKPRIDELGYSFLFRNYRPEHCKWQTADPLGYPDGWNAMAYVNNAPLLNIDYLGLIDTSYEHSCDLLWLGKKSGVISWNSNDYVDGAITPDIFGVTLTENMDEQSYFQGTDIFEVIGLGYHEISLLTLVVINYSPEQKGKPNRWCEYDVSNNRYRNVVEETWYQKYTAQFLWNPLYNPEYLERSGRLGMVKITAYGIWIEE